VGLAVNVAVGGARVERGIGVSVAGWPAAGGVSVGAVTTPCVGNCTSEGCAAATVCATDVLILSSELIAGVLPHETSNKINSPKNPVLSNLPGMVSSVSNTFHHIIIQTSCSFFLHSGISISLSESSFCVMLTKKSGLSIIKT
jgi:hypothetical protein